MPGAEVLGVQTSRGSLARTGLDLGLTVVAGLALLAMGVALRRTAAQAVS